MALAASREAVANKLTVEQRMMLQAYTRWVRKKLGLERLRTRATVFDGLLQHLPELWGVLVAVRLDRVLHRYFHELLLRVGGYPQCTSPHGLAFDSATRRLFISCVNNILAVIDAETGATVANVPIGSGTDAAAFDPKRNLIFSSNGRDGTLSMIRELDANHFVAVGTIKTAITARTMAIDPISGRLYIAAADVDATAAAHGAPPAPGARRPLPIVPGSLKLLFLDPVP
jgi:hypothetical protein